MIWQSHFWGYILLDILVIRNMHFMGMYFFSKNYLLDSEAIINCLKEWASQMTII